MPAAFRTRTGPVLHDALAGFSVALMLVPQAIAFAQIVGVPTHHGLWASTLPAIAAAFFASSPYLQTGPTAMTPLKLPHSGILISLPTEYRERAVPENGEILRPDYWVENSVTDVQTGRDAAFEKALELLISEGK